MDTSSTFESTKDTIIVELNHTDVHCLALAMHYRIKDLLRYPMTQEIFEELAMLTMTNLKFMPIVAEKVLQEQQEPLEIIALPS